MVADVSRAVDMDLEALGVDVDQACDLAFVLAMEHRPFFTRSRGFEDEMDRGFWGEGAMGLALSSSSVAAVNGARGEARF